MTVSLAWFPTDPAALFALGITLAIAVLLFVAGRGRGGKRGSGDES
jgi:hypothetical protein